MPSDIGPTFDGSSLPLFGPDNQPKPEDIGQLLDDCYFMAALTAIAIHKPNDLFSIVAKTGDRYRVTFHQLQTPPFGIQRDDITDVILDATLPTSKARLIGGTWPLFIQRAYAGFRTGVNTYDSLNKGYPWVAFSELGFVPAYYYPGADMWATMMMGYLAQGNPAMISTPKDVKGLPLHEEHTYALVGVVEEGGKIFVITRNPWGFDGFGSDNDPLDGLQKLPWDSWRQLQGRRLRAGCR